MEMAPANMLAKTANACRNRKSRIPEGIHEIEDHALHLPNDDLYLLLVNLETEHPKGIDPVWRGDIKRRIAWIPAEVERRYRYHNGGWMDEE